MQIYSLRSIIMKYNKRMKKVHLYISNKENFQYSELWKIVQWTTFVCVSSIPSIY